MPIKPKIVLVHSYELPTQYRLTHWVMSSSSLNDLHLHKMIKILSKNRFNIVLSLFVFNLLLQPVSSLAEMPKTKATNWKEEKEFTYAGKCFNGRNYWMFASEKIEDGHVILFYTYKGPVGSGTVRTDTSPKVMVQRICREQADIVANL